MPLKSTREYFNPTEWVRQQGFVYGFDHITFDPKLVPEYRVIRGSAHDGTLLFTNELIYAALTPLVLMQSYYKDTEPRDWTTVDMLRYTVGFARRAVVYGKVKVPVGCIYGQRERVCIPVRCEYVLKEP